MTERPPLGGLNNIIEKQLAKPWGVPHGFFVPGASVRGTYPKAPLLIIGPNHRLTV